MKVPVSENNNDSNLGEVKVDCWTDIKNLNDSISWNVYWVIEQKNEISKSDKAKFNELLDSIHYWDYKKASKIILNKKHIINLKDDYWRTPLIHTILYINKDDLHPDDAEWELITRRESKNKIAQLLLENWADINEQDNDWYTALMYAWYIQSKEDIIFLIENWADIDIVNNNWQTVLNVAFYQKAWEVIWILEKAYIEKHGNKPMSFSRKVKAIFTWK